MAPCCFCSRMPLERSGDAIANRAAAEAKSGENMFSFFIITYRPELKTNWSEHPQSTLISCKPIGYEHCTALIRQVAGQAQT